jgi:hypothetical protein
VVAGFDVSISGRIRVSTEESINVDPAAVPLRGLATSEKAFHRFPVLDTRSSYTQCAQVYPVGAIEVIH